MGYIKQDDLVQNMTPEQRILVQQFYARFDNAPNAGLNRKITNVETFYFLGAIGGELTVYAATKLYLCLELEVVCSSGTVVGAAGGLIAFYNELNNLFYTTNNNAVAYGVAYSYLANPANEKNFWFSNLASPNGVLDYAKFIGYRITLA